MTSKHSGRFGSMALLIAAALVSGRPAKGQEANASEKATSDTSSGRLPATPGEKGTGAPSSCETASDAEADKERKASELAATKTLAIWDADKNGAVSGDEYLDFMRKHVTGLDEDLTRRAFEALDENSDGSVSVEEYRNYIENVQREAKKAGGKVASPNPPAPSPQEVPDSNK